MSKSDRMHFRMMSLVHDDLYRLFRDPFRVLNAAGLKPGQKVLEVGCGPGFFTIPTAKIVGEKGSVYALDINPLAVKSVQQKINNEGVTNIKTILADATQTGLPDQSVDLVFLFGFVHSVGDLENILTELHRLLKPEGTLSIEASPWLSKEKLVKAVEKSELFYPLKWQRRIFQFRKIKGGDENG